MISLQGAFWEVVVRPVPLTILVVALVAAAVFGGRLARRRGASPVAGVLFLAGVGVVLALTGAADTRHAEDFTPPPGAFGFLHRLFDPSRVVSVVTSLPAGDEQWANVALYVPIGLLAQAFWRRADCSIGFTVLLSVVIEMWQSYVGRSADLVDVRNNSAGGLLGVIIYFAIGAAVRDQARRLLQRVRAGRMAAASAAVTAAAVAVLLGVVVWQQGYHNRPPEESLLLVDPNVADHELLDSVLDIVSARANGEPQFSYLPETPPPGLRRMGGGSTAPIIDSYDLTDRTIRQVSVEFSAQPAAACTDMSTPETAQGCTRSGWLQPAPSDPRFRHVTVYLYGPGAGKSSPSYLAAKSYWSKTKLVPIDEAKWFTDLVTRAKAAPKAAHR